MHGERARGLASALGLEAVGSMPRAASSLVHLLPRLDGGALGCNRFSPPERHEERRRLRGLEAMGRQRCAFANARHGRRLAW